MRAYGAQLLGSPAQDCDGRSRRKDASAAARGPGSFGEDGCVASRCPKAGEAPRETRRGTEGGQYQVQERRGSRPAGPRGRPSREKSLRPRPPRGAYSPKALGPDCSKPLAAKLLRTIVISDATPSAASCGCKPARLRRYASPRAPHAADRPGSPRLLSLPKLCDAPPAARVTKKKITTLPISISEPCKTSVRTTDTKPPIEV